MSVLSDTPNGIYLLKLVLKLNFYHIRSSQLEHSVFNI